MGASFLVAPSGPCLLLAVVLCQLLRWLREHLVFETVHTARTLAGWSSSVIPHPVLGGLCQTRHFTPFGGDLLSTRHRASSLAAVLSNAPSGRSR